MNEQILSQLERLAKLKEQGILTDEELQRQKAIILGPSEAKKEVQSTPLASTPIKHQESEIPKPVTGNPEKNNNVLIALAIAVTAIVIVIFSMDSKKDEVNYGSPSTLPTDTTVSRPSSATGTADVPITPTTKWQYYDEDNVMNGKEYFASITANNPLEFDFPYNGGSEATLTVRKMKGRTEALLRISKGQFITSFNDDQVVRIKFDSKPTGSYTISRASDGSSDVIFINGAKQIIAKMKKAERMLIEAEFYDSGNKQMEFDVKGLKWNH